MENAELIAVAEAEIEQPTFGATEQFLEIHQVKLQDGVPVVAGVTTSPVDNLARVYFAMEGEAFFLVVYLDMTPEVSIRSVSSEAWHRVFFSAFSHTLNLQQLAALTTLQPTESTDIGEKSKGWSVPSTFSDLDFEPTPTPDTFENKLNSLLDLLEKDPVGVRRLVEEAGGGIRVITGYHNGNSMLGGPHLDKIQIQRLAALNLEINFDLYAEGKFFKEE